MDLKYQFRKLQSTNISLLTEHWTTRALLWLWWITFLLGHQVKTCSLDTDQFAWFLPRLQVLWLTHLCKNNCKQCWLQTITIAIHGITYMQWSRISEHCCICTTKCQDGWGGKEPLEVIWSSMAAWSQHCTNLNASIRDTPAGPPPYSLTELEKCTKWLWSITKIKSVFSRSGSALTSTTWFYNKNILYPLWLTFFGRDGSNCLFK